MLPFLLLVYHLEGVKVYALVLLELVVELGILC